MDSVALIAPDFSIILLGLLLRLKFDYSEDFWKQAERLVFYVLFPPLLFTSIFGSSLSLGESAGFLATGVGAMLIGVCASWCIRYLVKADPVTHASLFQCGFRFNTYIGFALALKLFGDQGFALLALLIAFWVPISNTIAVSALAGAVAKRDAALGKQTNGSKPSLMVVTGKAVVQNPLIIATVLGLCCNLLGITVPATIHHFLKGLGNASLAMGLLCIGAGLRFAALRGSWGLILTGAVQRLMLLPLAAWGVTA
ncbi:AEC family transporter, partial [Sutterella wadsworthensis]|uniref:AEC family transporter n=1 Tax=Sutterella wadsworthensis TaxID=40545 RepID=UPI00402AD8E8